MVGGMAHDELTQRLPVTRTDLPGLLDATEKAPPGASVEATARLLLSSMGAREVCFFIADLSGECLVSLTRAGASEARNGDALPDRVSIGSSLAGAAFSEQRTIVTHTDVGVLVCAPVTMRGDAIGVLQLVLPNDPSVETINEISGAAHALGYIVVANRRHTDLYEWGQRGGPMTLAAEIQRRLTPGSITCESDFFTVAGWLEASANVAGDTFDYSFDETTLSLSMTDAMGHSTNSALLATIAVASLRNSRQARVDIKTRARLANEAMLSNSDDDQFVTGILMSVPLDGSRVSYVNAGHPSPFLVRHGTVTNVPTAADLPFGMFAESTYREQFFDLQPGDRLIIVTDGLLERNASNFDIEAEIAELQGLHARDVVRRLCRDVTKAAGGALQDDATALCLDWRGPSSVVHVDSAPEIVDL